MATINNTFSTTRSQAIPERLKKFNDSSAFIAPVSSNSTSHKVMSVKKAAIPICEKKARQARRNVFGQNRYFMFVSDSMFDIAERRFGPTIDIFDSSSSDARPVQFTSSQKPETFSVP